MSAPGQTIDPVQALANQQVQAAIPQGGSQQIDPVQALAMGQQISAPPEQTFSPSVQIPSHSHEDAGGSFLRSMMAGATFNMANPAAAALDATFPGMNKKFNIPDVIDPSQAPDWMKRYRENLTAISGQDTGNRAAHPIASITGGIAGGFVNPVARSLGVPSNLGTAVLQGAGLGAGYGLGSGINDQQDLPGIAKQAAIGATTGAVLAPVTYGLGKLLSGGTKTADAAALNDEGIPTTIGQTSGGSSQRIEDANTSIPVFGDAIKNQQRSGIIELNRATYNRALEPLGLQYSKTGPVGNKGIQKVGELIGDAYDRAYDGATAKFTPDILSSLKDTVSETGNVATPEKVALVQKNIDRLITSKLDQDGNLSADALKTAKNWFAEQAQSSPTAGMEDKAIAGAYKNVLGAIKGGIGEADPDKGALLNSADKAYMQFARIAQAASSNNASGNKGIFTPAQLGQAIRGMDDSTRHLEFARGSAPLQDLAQAGQESLAPTLPDSGTPMRYVMEHPISAALTSPYWLAGKALYSNTGQSIAKALMYGAPDARKAIGGIPMQALPGALSLAVPENSKRLGQRLKDQPQSEAQ